MEKSKMNDSLSRQLIKKIHWMLCFFMVSMNCLSTNHNNDELVKKIHEIEKKSNTIMGVTAIHIEQNKTISHNSAKHFFMASTIKVPIAIAFLNRVDEHKDSLNRQIKLGLHNSVPGSGSLYHLFEKKNISMSTQQILRHMLIHSDNSASDAILLAAHGPQSVTKRMNSLGFKNMHINRSILEMFMDTNHVDHSLLREHLPVVSWKRIFNKVPLDQKVLAWKHFQTDQRDTTTSEDMANLLVKLYKNQILSEANTRLLISIMEQCRTGRSRLKGLLPSNVKVAHKTGTWAIDEQNYLKYPGSKKLFRFVSDVGIITLPHNRGHIAIAVYVKSKAVSDQTRSRAIALTSRAIYDYFMKPKRSKATT